MPNNNPIFPSKLQEDLLVYRALPCNMRDKIMGVGFFRRWVSTEMYQNKINSDTAFVIVIVLEGEGIYTDHHNKSTRILPGSGFQRIPDKHHTFTIKSDQYYSELFLHIPKEFYQKIKMYGGADEELSVVKPGLDNPLVEKALQLSYKLKSANDLQLPSILLEVSTMMLDIIQKSGKSNIPSYHQSVIKDACKLLNENITDIISMQELAQSFNISYERFRKIFKNIMGVAPGEYRIKARIQFAQTLLLKRELNVNEIAHHMGYPDAFTFSKQFKKQIGVSPEIFLRNIFG